MTKSKKEHWNTIYANKPLEQLGWYEAQSTPSVDLIERCELPKDAPIVDIGSGRTALIFQLLELGYKNISAVDISDVALEKAKEFLSKENAARVNWIVDDITQSTAVQELENIALWHDRAVFHFLIDEKDRQSYKAILEKVIMPGGFVIMATFAMDGADKCSGFPVQRYSVESLSEFLGDGFKLIEGLEHTYQMPSGAPRPFTYARFQRI